MPIEKLIPMLIFFIVIITNGYIFGRRILKENSLIFLIPFSVCFGSATFTTLLHISSSFSNVTKGAYISLFFCTLASIFIFLKYKTEGSISLGLPKSKFILVLAFALLAGTLSFNYLHKFDNYDPGLYMLVGLMTKENKYPIQNPYGADISLVYHDGVALFASGFKILTHIDALDSLHPVQTIFIFIYPIIIFLLLYSITSSFIASFTGQLIGVFCSNLHALKIFELFQPSIYSNSKEFLRTIYWMADSVFISPAQKALLSPNSSIAIPTSIFLFYLCTKEKSISKRYIIPVLFISTFLFSSYEAYWLPITAAIFLFYLLKIFKNIQDRKQKEAITIVTILITLVFSPGLSAGIYENKNEHIAKLVHLDIKPYTYGYNNRTLKELYSSEWFTKNEIICHANGNKFYKVNFLSRYFFYEFGLPLILIPLVIVWLIRKKSSKLICLLLGGIASLVPPFIITYYPIEIETHRFLIFSRLIFSILLGGFIGFLFEVKLNTLFLKWLFRSALYLLTFVLIIPGICLLRPFENVKSNIYTTMFPESDKKAIRWLSEKSKSGDIGLGPWDIPFKCYELITLGGVYGLGTHTQNIAQEETRITALNTLNPCLLKELKVKWIYLNEKLLKIVPNQSLKNLIDERILILKYNYKNKNEIRQIYQFFPSKDIDKYCSNKNYAWHIGKLLEGKFIPIKIDSQVVFPSKKEALEKLSKLKDSFDLEEHEKLLYGIEALKEI